MASADDRMMIGVEYTGSQAIQQFGNDLDVLPREISEAMRLMGRAGAEDRLLANRGGAAGRAFVQALKLELAAAQGVLGNIRLTGLGGGGFGDLVAGQSVPKNATKQFEQIAAAANRAYEQIRNSGSRVIGSDHGYFEGLRASSAALERQTIRSMQALTGQRVELERLNRVPTQVERQIDSLKSAPLPEAARRAAMTGLVAQAAQISYTPELRAQMAYSSAQDRAVPITYEEIARRRAEGGAGNSQRQLAAEFGVDRAYVQRAERAYADLIESIKAEAAERREAARAAEAARALQNRVRNSDTLARLMANGETNRQYGIGTTQNGRVQPGASDGMGAAITPWARGTNAYYQTEMGQRFLRQNGLPLGSFGDSTTGFNRPAMAAADRTWWEQNYRSPIERLREAVAAGGEYRTFNSNGSGGGGFRDSFMSGFSGPNNRPQAEMLGQTARVALLYGVAYRALSMLQQGLETAVRETVAFEEALTSLNVVTGRSRAENQEFAETLGDIAVSAGFTPSQGVDLGSRALGLFGVASSDQATQERTVEISAEVASRMARVAGGDPVATQNQLAGALRSLGWGIDRLPELEDTVSYISRQTGQAPTQLLGAVANTATLGTQSGFSPEQLTALLAQVATTTGQNPEGTAGQFRQLLSQNAALLTPRAEAIVGQDLTATNLQELFAQVSQLDLTADQLNRFSALFGKGGSQQVAMILTQQYGEVQRLAGGASGAQGFGEDAFNEVMGSFGNKMRELGAIFADFGVTLIETGILDWLGAMVIAATELLEAGTAVLDFFNQLPRPLRAVALALAEIYAASLLMTRMGIGGGGRLGVASRAIAGVTPFGQRVVANSAERAIGPVMANGGFYSNQASLAAMIPAVLRTNLTDLFKAGGPLRLDAAGIEAARNGSGLVNRARAATGLSGTAMLGIAGVVAAGGALVGQGISIDNDAQQKVQEARAAAAAAESLSELKDAASQAGNSLQALKDAGLENLTPGDLLGFLPALMTDMLTGQEKAQLARIEAETSARAARAEQIQTDLVASDASNTFTDFSADGIESGMETLRNQGYDAAQALDLLNKAMFDFVTRSSGMQDAVAVIDPAEYEAVGTQVGDAGVSALQKVRDNFLEQAEAAAVDELGDGDANKYALKQTFPNPINWFETNMPWSKTQQARGKYDRFDLSDDEMTAVREALSGATQEALQDSVLSGGVLDSSGKTEILMSAKRALMNQLGPERWQELVKEGQDELLMTAFDNAVQGIIDAQGGDLKREDLSGYLERLPDNVDAATQVQELRTGNSEQANAYRLQTLLDERANAVALIDATGGGMTDEEKRRLDYIDLLIGAAKRTVLEDRLDSIRNLTSFNQAMLAEDDTFGRLEAEAAGIAAERGADAESVNGNLNDPNYLKREQDRQAREATNGRAVAAAELQRQQNQALANLSGGDALGRTRVAMNNARLTWEAATKGSPEEAAAANALQMAKFDWAQAQVQNANANRLAAIDPRNDLGRIQAQIQGLRAEAANLPRNQRGALLDQINSLNQQYAQTLVDQANAAASAGIAGNRSSLDQARVSLDNANRSLSTQLSGTAGYYNALATLRNAQSELAQAEREQADRLRRLNSDLTDPVEQARLDVQKAREQLAADQSSGQGADVIAQSQLDLRSAENAAEQAAFQQRISDLQTAEDLGRISHTAYMSYLQSEHDRLTAIADRTRQQQDQLDQVDQLMKAAAEQIQGQFNIGDIDLPTIYEVRRAIGSGAPTQVADYSNSNNVVTVNGADFAAVVEWLQRTLGAGAQVVTAATPRRI